VAPHLTGVICDTDASHHTVKHLAPVDSRVTGLPQILSDRTTPHPVTGLLRTRWPDYSIPIRSRMASEAVQNCRLATFGAEPVTDIDPRWHVRPPTLASGFDGDRAG
jgi:hypothetical protein